MGTVLAPDDGNISDQEAPPGHRDTGSMLPVDYQRIVEALADRRRLHQEPLICQELAVMFGLDAVPAKVATLRSKA